MTKDVIVVTGIGGIGMAVARRMGSGAKLVLLDYNKERLALAATTLNADGYDVVPLALDVSDREAVTALAESTHSLLINNQRRLILLILICTKKFLTNLT